MFGTEMQEVKRNEAAGAQSLPQLIVTIIVAEIMIVAAAIPVCESVITSAALTGTTATIVSLVPVFLGLGGLVVATYLIYSATG